MDYFLTQPPIQYKNISQTEAILSRIYDLLYLQFPGMIINSMNDHQFNIGDTIIFTYYGGDSIEIPMNEMNYMNKHKIIITVYNSENSEIYLYSLLNHVIDLLPNFPDYTHAIIDVLKNEIKVVYFNK